MAEQFIEIKSQLRFEALIEKGCDVDAIPKHDCTG